MIAVEDPVMSLCRCYALITSIGNYIHNVKDHCMQLNFGQITSAVDV
jgi:hypothetical protein